MINVTSGQVISYSMLGFRELKLYLAVLLFSAGNVILPSFFHLILLAGNVYLPIYFFVLIAGYKYGWKAGVLTAILSPMANYVITGMPIPAMLSIIIAKGLYLAIASSFMARKGSQYILINIILIILFYQILGLITQFILIENFSILKSDFIVGYPGLIIQLVGGYFVIKIFNRYL